jgi:U4/U6.U5 tri-snRNP-associated protein 2
MSDIKRARLDHKECPYVNTIDRTTLNFDFEKVCSVSLSSRNVYCCLVCGKYFQGRGTGTHAYEHSLEHGHFMFLRLADGSVFCLPDNYEVNGPFEDIRQNLRPLFTREEVEGLERMSEPALSLLGTEYIPGVVGLNKLGQADYLSSVVQSLTVVLPLRRWLLLNDHSSEDDHVCMSLSELFRKLYNLKSFRIAVSPHEFLQAVSVASKKTFFNKPADPIAFLSWLFAHLSRKLKKSNIIEQTFTGEIRISSDSEPQVTNSPFSLLVLDLPPTPVFKEEASFIPTVSIYDLLAKFDGQTAQIAPDGSSRRFKIKRLPEYLMIGYKRFTRNEFFAEKNSTLVKVPIVGLDMSAYCLNIGDEVRYDLVAQVTHEGNAEGGTYRSYVFNEPKSQWYELQDLRVAEVLPEQVALAEAYIQIFRRVAQ